MSWDSVLSWFAVAGAVGTAAMGLVEALKVVTIPRVGSLATVGLGKVRRCLGKPAMHALERVYGRHAGDALLEGAWRKGPDQLEQVLRNGLRMAVFADLRDLDRFVAAFGQNPEEVSEAVKHLRAGDGGADRLAHDREIVARLEAAIDAHVEAAVAAGRDAYVSSMQIVASGVAVVGSAFAAGLMPGTQNVGPAILIGLLAVPIAPVAKDVATFLNSLRTAFDKRGARA